MFIYIFSIVTFGCIVGSLLFCALYALCDFYDFKIKTIGRNFILITCVLLIISIINFNTKTEVCSVNEKYTKIIPCDELDYNAVHVHYIFTNSHGKKWIFVQKESVH